jgi:hypothetical protein
VQYVGQVEDGRYRSLTTCTAWAEAINDGEYSHVVIAAFALDDDGDPYDWTRADPAATLLEDFDRASPLFRSGFGTALFELHGALDPDRCRT